MTKKAKAEAKSLQKQIKGVLESAIGPQIKKVVAWLRKRFPDGYGKYFFHNKSLNRIRFYIFLRLGFDFDGNRDVTKKWVGFEHAEYIFPREYTENHAEADQV